MIKVYYGSNIDAINWKIYSDYINKAIRFFPTNTSSSEIANQLCQCSLFDMGAPYDVYVVNINKWKLTDEATIQNIKDLHSLNKPIIFAFESTAVKNKVFTSLDIQKVKATAITKKSKALMVHKLLEKAKITLQPQCEGLLVEILPEQIEFIQNEITKMQLLGQKSFTEKAIKQIVFDLGDATIFNIADSWINGNQEQTIERLNDLMSKNVTIQAFIPIFALKLVQIKLFLTAKLARWSSDIITSAMGIPFWLQSSYNNLRPYDKNLDRINNILDKLYHFDINVKKQRNIPYTQLIKILFE
ncbi:MAG: hypothetical protein ACOQNV_02570 [Mycoplasmoidaceae bacterium]